MKKKLFVLLLSIISVVCLAFGVSACSKTKTDNIAVTSVSISTTEISLEVGESYTLSATILPSNATNTNMTWSSSATSVATVSGGKVAAISEGTAIITVTTTDGGYTDTCSVTVTETQETPSTVSVTSVNLSETSLSLEAGGTYTLTATVLPSDATDKTITWSSSDESVAIVNNGAITAVAAGTATITITTTDGGYTATCTVTVKEETPKTVTVTSVSLNTNALILTVGGTSTLTATVLPRNATNQNVSWTSSDSSVCTVSDGTIAAVSAGTATITVTTEDGGYTAECAVTVNEETPDTVAVTLVSLDTTNISLDIGGTYTLTATILPSNATNQNITWSSSNTSVATVNNGTVTAVAAGTVTITVTTEDGGYTAECTVVVTEPTISVTSVSLNYSALSLVVGGSSTLIATISPSNATNQNITWTSSNTSVATINNGTITAVSAGTATITVTTEDGNHTATCTVSVAAATAAVLSVNNATINGSEIYLLEDYTTTSVSLSGAVTCSDNCGWKLYDTDGKTVIDTKVITSLADGANTYYIVVTSTLDSTVTNTYILTVYKSFAVTVSYYNGDSVIKTETVYTGYTYSADYTPDITGYTFNYWKTNDGQAYSATIILDNLNLYANTTAKTYTITYDANGGTVNETETAVTYDLSYTLAVPERTGYSFGGWHYGETQLTDRNGNSLAVWNYTEDLTVTADWSINSYTVTLELSYSSAGCVTGSGTYNYNSEVTITATTNIGYTWIGWYKDGDLYTTDYSFTYTVTAIDITFTATYEVYSDLLNFEFTSTTTTCEITGLKDYTITEIIVPDYVTFISGGAFSGCSSLVSITLPFVGLSATSTSSSALFGYIFGTSSYTGGTSTEQYYASTKYITYYVPATLKSVTITGGNILYGAFYNCTSLTSIEITDSVSSIEGSYVFFGCTAEIIWGENPAIISISTEEFAYYAGTSITIPDSVTSIGYYAFANCTSLKSVIV